MKFKQERPEERTSQAEGAVANNLFTTQKLVEKDNPNDPVGQVKAYGVSLRKEKKLLEKHMLSADPDLESNEKREELIEAKWQQLLAEISSEAYGLNEFKNAAQVKVDTETKLKAEIVAKKGKESQRLQGEISTLADEISKRKANRYEGVPELEAQLETFKTRVKNL